MVNVLTSAKSSGRFGFLAVAGWMMGAVVGFAEGRTPAFVVTSDAGAGVLDPTARRNVSVDISLCALASDADEHGHEYGLVGMPVRVYVSIGNGPADGWRELSESGTPVGEARWPAPVAVLSNWYEQVVFAVTRPDGTVVSNTPAEWLPYDGRWFYTAARPGFKGEQTDGLHCTFLMSTSVVGCTEGDYVVGASWRGVTGEQSQRTLTVRAAAGEREKAKLRFAQAIASHGRGEFDSAVKGFDAVIGEQGQLDIRVREWVLRYKGDSLFAANRLQDALAVYRECAAIDAREKRGNHYTQMSLSNRVSMVERFINAANGGGQ